MFDAKHSLTKNGDFTFKWFLDSISLLAVNQEKIKVLIEGWVLGNEEHEIAALSVKDGGQIHEVKLNVSRRDVLKRHVEPAALEGLPQPYCGFKSEVELGGTSLELGVVIDGVFVSAARLEIVVPDVIIGESGWVFLDKDTNGSVAQFRGVKQVSKDWDSGWARYFSAVENYLHGRCKYTFLLAPSKEEVLTEEYPFARARRTLVDRWLSAHGEFITWPLDQLRAHKYLCYDAAETHWTDHGANLALSSALQAMGEEKLAAVKPSYEVVSIRGDLGDKVSPVVRSVRLKTLPSETSGLVSNNNIVNHGNVKRFKNASAAINKKLLVFGGSSSNYMLAHAANLFEDVMFVHTTGAIDKRVLEDFSPDFVILQTNQRFIVSPPSPFIDVSIYANKAVVKQ